MRRKEEQTSSAFRQRLGQARRELKMDVALKRSWHLPEEELLVAFEIANKQLQSVSRNLFRRIELRLQEGPFPKLRGFTPIKFNILRTLDDYSPKWQREIQQILVFNVDKASLSETLRQMLTDKQIVRRRSVEDARAWEIRISSSGKKLLKAAEEDYHLILPQLFRGMTRAQQNDMMVLLHVFKHNLLELLSLQSNP